MRSSRLWMANGYALIAGGIEEGEMTFLEITLLVHEERERQIVKWGEQHHSHLEWLAILVEEVGEVAKASVKLLIDYEDTKQEILTEVIHCAAVCMAWLEDKLLTDKSSEVAG